MRLSEVVRGGACMAPSNVYLCSSGGEGWIELDGAFGSMYK